MNKLILLAIFFSSCLCKSQTCVISPPNSSEASKGSGCDYNALNSEKYCINVFFHIVRDNDGTNGFSSTQIPNIVSFLNQYFNPHNITIVNFGYDYINNTELNDLGQSEFNTLTNIGSNANAINFYLVKNLFASGAAVLNSQRLVVSNNNALTTTSCHELGHCLSLQHTSHGTTQTVNDPGGCYENTNGSNCLTCGDFICDTPSTASVNPDATNIMIAYSYNSNLNHFTSGQGLRMRNAIKCNFLSTRSNICSTITGSDKICASGNYTYTIVDGVPNSSVVWGVTSNLLIVNSSNNNITVKSVNSTINGLATITATIGGIVKTKTIWVGKPLFNVVRDTNEYCDSNFHYLTIEVINYDTTSSNHNYNWSYYNYPGMTFTPIGNNKFVFRFNYNFTDYFDLSVTETNNCGSTTFYTEQEVKLCGTFTNQYSQMATQSLYNVYPNPAIDVINIDLVDNELNPTESAIIVAELFDMKGQLRAKKGIVNNITKIDVQALPKGIYILNISVNGTIESHQIVVE